MLPSTISSICKSRDELEAVTWCYQIIPFYRLPKHENRADRLKQSFETSLDNLKALIEMGVSLGEHDVLKKQLSDIEVPDFKYASSAGYKKQYKKACEEKLQIFGKKRRALILSLLVEEFSAEK